MKIEVNGFSFDFPDALSAFIFDEQDSTQAHFHGLSHAMKAVDCIVELPTRFLFIEVKHFPVPDDYMLDIGSNYTEGKRKNKHLNSLIENLKYKYRDSWLYRWAEEKVNKPIFYLCLLTLENAQVNFLQKQLKHQLPVGCAAARWRREIAWDCLVLNLDRWKHNFPQWPVQRL